jgi:hypothetical protein
MSRLNFDAGTRAEGAESPTDPDTSDGQTEGDRPDPIDRDAWDEMIDEAQERRAGENAEPTTIMVRVDAFAASNAIPDGEIHVLVPGGHMEDSIRPGDRFQRFEFILGEPKNIEVIVRTNERDYRKIQRVEPGEAKQFTFRLEIEPEATARDASEVYEDQEEIDTGSSVGPEDFVTESERAPDHSEFHEGTETESDGNDGPIADGGVPVIIGAGTQGGSLFDGLFILSALATALYAAWEVLS